MDTVLVSSGFSPNMLHEIRGRWHVLDIEDHRAALEQLGQMDELPLAVVIGRALPVSGGTVSADNKYDRRQRQLKPDLPAHEMLERVLQMDGDLPVIVSTGLAQPRSIVSLVQQGAFDYVIEPPQPRQPEREFEFAQELRIALERAVRWRKAILENRLLRSATLGEDSPDLDIQGQSGAIRQIMQTVRRVAPTPATVLVTGESGTGKELVAQAIHRLSDRHNEPFLAVNCAGLDDALLSSELFGHAQGAFTGAQIARKGLIRQADRGTLLLDEVASVSSAFQVALLRTLEQRTARAVGSETEYAVQCRFIAASNRDIGQLVERGAFREDLYYRLNVFEIHLPALRDRPEDIPILAQYFLDRISTRYERPARRFTPSAMEALEGYSWPGNVRQLRNVVERAVILSDGEVIRYSDVAGSLRTRQSSSQDGSDDAGLKGMLESYERRVIQNVLQRTSGNLAEAARRLQIKRTTLHYRLKMLGLQR